MSIPTQAPTHTCVPPPPPPVGQPNAGKVPDQASRAPHSPPSGMTGPGAQSLSGHPSRLGRGPTEAGPEEAPAGRPTASTCPMAQAEGDHPCPPCPRPYLEEQMGSGWRRWKRPEGSGQEGSGQKRLGQEGSGQQRLAQEGSGPDGHGENRSGPEGQGEEGEGQEGSGQENQREEEAPPGNAATCGRKQDPQ